MSPTVGQKHGCDDTVFICNCFSDSYNLLGKVLIQGELCSRFNSKTKLLENVLWTQILLGVECWGRRRRRNSSHDSRQDLQMSLLHPHKKTKQTTACFHPGLKLQPWHFLHFWVLRNNTDLEAGKPPGLYGGWPGTERAGAVTCLHAWSQGHLLSGGVGTGRQVWWFDTSHSFLEPQTCKSSNYPHPHNVL